MNHRAAVVLTIVGALALGPASSASAQLANYDTFNFTAPDPPEIDPFKWRGQDSIFNSTLGVRNTEVTRKITANKLELAVRTFGSAGTDTGVTGTGRSRVLVNHPALLDGDPPITAIQVKATFKAARNQDCPANTSQGISRVSVSGFFFNDGTANATAGDLVGDILAGVNLDRNSKLGDRITAFISRCDEAPCSAADALQTVEFTRRSWKINTAETITIRWRKATKDFQFTVARVGGGPTQTQVLTYGDILPFDHELPKIGAFYQMGSQNTVLNCTAGRREGFVDAFFDNYKLNPEAVAATGP